MASIALVQNPESWLLIMDVQKNKNVEWYGTCAIFHDPSRNSSFIVKSYDAKNNKHAQILILREALLKLKGRNITSLSCFDNWNI